jgi:uncharacterized protein (TIGR02246 family)
MKRLVVFLCGALTTVAAGVTAQEAAKPAEAATALVDAFGTAWAEGDAAALADLFLSDGDYVSAVGRVARGREEIAALFADEQGSFMKGTRLTFSGVRARSLESDLMLIDASAELRGVEGPQGRAVTPLRHQLVAVARRQKGTWRLLAARLSVPVPAPPGR